MEARVDHVGKMLLFYPLEVPSLAGFSRIIYKNVLEVKATTNYSLVLVCVVTNELPHEKTNNVVSDQVGHKPRYTITDNGYRLEILGLESRGFLLPV